MRYFLIFVAISLTLIAKDRSIYIESMKLGAMPVHHCRKTLILVTFGWWWWWWWWWIDELFLRNGWPTKEVYALFPAETIVRDSHHRKSPTPRRICVQTCWMTLCCSDNTYINWNQVYHDITTRDIMMDLITS